MDPRNGVAVTSPVKAHLQDGSTVVYNKGVTVSGGMLLGAGERWDLTATKHATVDMIPLDTVVGMESFQTRVNVRRTVLGSSLVTAALIVPPAAVLATGGGVIATSIAAVGGGFGSDMLRFAIFGSCPTIYSGNGATEEAELFSTSIAPLLEARAVDRLQAQPDSNGILRLEARNEAMETHYINHLQIFEVNHAAGEIVLPDLQDHPIAVRGIHVPTTIASRSGEDLRGTLGAADDRFYRSDPRVIDWLGDGLGRISTAVELGRWYERRAGLHISVWRDGAYREVARIPDSGPIFWHDVAAAIPVLPGETSLRVRLSFIADYWRIDRVGVAETARQAVPRVIEISSVSGSDGRAEDSARDSMSAPDDRYLQTSPGQRFFADFNVGRAAAGQQRTFLLSSQGYYTEWIRGAWIQTATAKTPFAPTDDAVLAALRQWPAARESFEERFFKNRVPVR